MSHPLALSADLSTPTAVRDASKASTSSSVSSTHSRVTASRPRPGYFDLQKLAQQADEIESEGQASSSRLHGHPRISPGTHSYPDSTNSESAAGDSESGYASDDTIDENDRARPSPLPSRAPSRAATLAPSFRTRPPSRSAARSPVPTATATRALSLAPSDTDDDGDALVERQSRRRYLSSLHQLSDAELERIATVGSSAQPPKSASGDSTEEDSCSRPEASSDAVLVTRTSLIRELSVALKVAIEEGSVHREALEGVQKSHAVATGAQRRRHEAREAALKAILKEAGVSQLRVERALMHATTQSEVPTFQADERREEASDTAAAAAVGSAAQAGTSRASNSREELISLGDEGLPESLREAMLENLSAAGGDELSRAHLNVHDQNTVRARRPGRDNNGERASALSAPDDLSDAPAASDAGIDDKSSGRSVRQSGTIRSNKTVSDKGSDKSPRPSRAPSVSSTRSAPSARHGAATSGFAWGLWGSSSVAQSKAAPSVHAVSPADVEADGYLSDGGQPVVGSSAHAKYASVSAAPLHVPESPRARATSSPSDQASAGGNRVLSGLSMMGSIAWRRKPKPVAAPACADPVASQAAPNLQNGKPASSQATDHTGSMRAKSAAAGSDASTEQTREPAGRSTVSMSDALQEALDPEGAAVRDKQNLTHVDPKKDSSRDDSSPTRPRASASSATSETGSSSRRTSTNVEARAAPPSSAAPSIGTSAAILGQTLGRHDKRLKKRTTQRQTSHVGSAGSVQPNVTRVPGMFSFGRSAAKEPAQGAQREDTQSPRQAAQAGAVDSHTGTAVSPPAPSVELEPIIANDSKPPSLAIFAKQGVQLIPQRAPANRDRAAARAKALSRLEEEAGSSESSGDEFEVYGGKGLVMMAPPKPLNAREQSDNELLTDRYGFVYDATSADVRLLRQARRAATPAPACLTGIRVGVRARGGSDSQSEEDKEDDADLLSPDSEDEAQATQEPAAELLGLAETPLEEPEDLLEGAESHISEPGSVVSSSSRKVAGMQAGNGKAGSSQSPTASHGLLSVTRSKPMTEASSLNVPSQSSVESGPTSPSAEREFQFASQSSAPNETMRASTKSARAPPHSTSQTVKRLLGQLEQMHEDQQAEQKAKWDDFLESRRKAVSSRAGTRVQSSLPVNAGASAGSAARLAGVVRKSGGQMLGLSVSDDASGLAQVADVPEEAWQQGMIGVNRMGDSKLGKDHWRVFLRLCQAGIPLIYRSKVWTECSGAIEAAEPGRYQELLAEHQGDANQCTEQIDLDVHRTMPTNVYFGGDGPGVPKLRRLLVAYSWYNPTCGYCQGMNNLAATLLLTHATEEDAFWVLVMIIERILPSEYYTSHLLVSQADQRVLIDLVGELLPDLRAHVDALGVDLPAVTFAWFLSLYTDCLPVETLFRVWDVLFVEGMVVLFRVALAILALNEKELLAATSASAIYSHMHSMTSKLFNADKLITLACEELKTAIRYADILILREKHVADLESELGLT